jgi:hypothetical protein
VTSACQTSRIGEIGGNFLLVYRRVIAHWRVIVLGLILARAVFYVIHPDEFGLFFDLLSLGLLFIHLQKNRACSPIVPGFPMGMLHRNLLRA